MKRVLFVLAALLLPLSVMAMTPVSDNDLSNVTGQAGVTIGVSNLQITMDFDTLTYGDLDGAPNIAAGGFVDVDGDSVQDLVADIDNDGDGNFDVVEDLNGNGTLDTALDEVADSIDYNGDGDMLDVVDEDVDGDGNLDTVADIDADSDGNFDVVESLNYYDAAGYVNMSIEDVPMHVNIAALTLTIDVGTDSFGETAVIIGISDFAMSLDAFAIKAIYLDGDNGVVTDYGYNNLYADPFAPVGMYSEWDAAGHTYAVTPGTLDPACSKSLGWVGISGLGVSIPSATITISAH